MANITLQNLGKYVFVGSEYTDLMPKTGNDSYSAERALTDGQTDGRTDRQKHVS